MARKPLQNVAQVAEQLHRGGFTSEEAWALIEQVLIDEPELQHDLDGLRLRALELDREMHPSRVPVQRSRYPMLGCLGILLCVWGATWAVWLVVRWILETVR